MACTCGQNHPSPGLTRRHAPTWFPPLIPGGGFYLEDRRWPGGAAAAAPCPQWLADFARSGACTFFEVCLGAPIAAFLAEYCATGNTSEAGKRTARSLVTSCTILAIALPIAAVIAVFALPPAVPIFGALTPVAVALIPIFDAMGKGQALPAGAGGKLAAATGRVGGMSDDDAAKLAGVTDVALEQAGKQLPAVTMVASTPQRTEQYRAHAKKMAVLKALRRKAFEAAKAAAKAKSGDRAAACKARGGVFDPKAPDGCRVGASSTTGGLFGFLAKIPKPVLAAAATKALGVW